MSIASRIGVAAPRLQSLHAPDIRVFLKERELYCREVEEHNLRLDDGDAVVPVRVKHSMDPSMLDIICDYELDEPKDTVSDEVLMEFLRGRVVDTLKETQLLDFEERLRDHLVTDTSKATCVSYMMMLWACAEAFKTSHQVHDLLKDKKSFERFRNIFIESIAISKLKSRVTLMVKGFSTESKAARKSMKGFYKCLMECTRLQDAENALNIARKNHSKSSDRDHSGMDSKGSRHKKRFITETEKKNRFGKAYRSSVHRSNKRSQGDNNTPSDRDRSPKRQKRPCLKCQSTDHLVFQCPRIESRDEAQRLLAEWRQQGRQNQISAVGSNQSR